MKEKCSDSFTEETVRSVCLTGHRSLTDAEIAVAVDKLKKIIPELYAKGYRNFYCGGALGFDLLAADVVLQAKILCPDIRLNIVIPCPSQSTRWKAVDRAIYERMVAEADDTILLSDHYYHGCMIVRDRYMVDRSNLCLCYLNKQNGGTFYTACYAYRKGLEVINLALKR